jgi:hypothetical protein
MKAQTPAEGVMKTGGWGDTQSYKVVCGCGQPDHEHNVWVEAEETGITVQTFVTVKSNWWTEHVKKEYNIDNPWLQEFDWFWKDLWNGLVTRIRLTWTLWTKGYVEYETCITMDQQQALNYAETLKKAIKDVEYFRNGKRASEENKQVLKAVNEQDCV